MTDLLPILLEIKEDVGATRACVDGMCAAHARLEARVVTLEDANEQRRRQFARIGGIASAVAIVAGFLATNLDKVAKAFQ